ncbi:Pol Polyprotein [Phytophthora megakarya]|uniref:Pol Polyprotein n=1 Tax=Phytophthora megakarya TaxID=4795 RepID=A0A225W2K2_9STRA|nr:Pol Polyprotein [Phytophthora megakarya]
MSDQGDDAFRQTCDYRLVNDLIEVLISTMLHMSTLLEHTRETPRGVPQGCCDAAVHFQQTMEHWFESLLDHSLVIWIDDLVLVAVDIDTDVTELERFFDFVASCGFVLSAKKSCLYRQSVKWCERIISKDGVAHVPAYIDTLREMPCPATAGELRQFLCAAT